MMNFFNPRRFANLIVVRKAASQLLKSRIVVGVLAFSIVSIVPQMVLTVWGIGYKFSDEQ